VRFSGISRGGGAVWISEGVFDWVEVWSLDLILYLCIFTFGSDFNFNLKFDYR